MISKPTWYHYFLIFCVPYFGEYARDVACNSGNLAWYGIFDTMIFVRNIVYLSTLVTSCFIYFFPMFGLCLTPFMFIWWYRYYNLIIETRNTMETVLSQKNHQF